MMYRGQLVSWKEDKGFGFIKTAELSKNTFIHISDLKKMSRKPKCGDYIYFEIEQANGKTKACNARIEGVKAKTSKPAKPHSNNNLTFVSLAIIIAIVVFASQHWNLIPNSTPHVSEPFSYQKSQANHFSCDGRQHCSQMTSRAEAEYFITHCPDTKMDGDHDGNPCENDSRF